MFLNESVNLEVVNSSSMYEAIMEANDAYHDLCMKMVKCEHTAIVTENAAMLNEANGDFKAKVANIAKTLLAKFLAFIDRIRAEWSKLWSNILSRFVDTKEVKAMKDLISKKRIKLEVDKKGIVNATKLFDEVYAIKGNDLETKLNETKAKLDAFKTTKETKTIDSSDIDAAIRFIEERPTWIKQLEGLKTVAKEAYKKTLESDETNGSQLILAKYSSIISKVIVRINNYTADAVKICRAARKEEKSNKYYDAAKENYKETNKQPKVKSAAGSAKVFGEGASILDQF